jgi:hypothetical protein
LSEKNHLDVEMPEMNGYEVLKIPKASRKIMGIPVIEDSSNNPSGNSANGVYSFYAPDFDSETGKYRPVFCISRGGAPLRDTAALSVFPDHQRN